MSQVPERPVEAPEIVRAPRRYGITPAEVDTVTGVLDRAVRKRQRPSIDPAPYDRRARAELRDLVALLSDSLSPRGVGQWMYARNRLLKAERPIDLLSAGRFDEVRLAARSFIEGSYV